MTHQIALLMSLTRLGLLRPISSVRYITCMLLLLVMHVSLIDVYGEPNSKPVDTNVPGLLGKRIITFCSVVRVNQIESGRDQNLGQDEGKIHTLHAVRVLRENFKKAFPGGRMTWALSWLALQDQRQNYCDIRKELVEYHRTLGDEITFIPGAYFAPMHNTREQVNKDLHDGLKLVSEMVGGGYRPKSVIAGFLAAENQRYLAEQEGIHVCQGTIWSQYGIDNGDGDGSISYPYYPSREHYCKPAQQSSDFIDIVCLDGWTCDFLNARRPGFSGGYNSRQGVGPIETVMGHGIERGTREQVHTTAIHFDDGFKRNGFAWVTNIFETCLAGASHTLPAYGEEVRRRWPDVQCITVGEFGEAFRSTYRDNTKLDYRFVERGSGIGGSDANLEIRWFMNKDFRLALVRDWTMDNLDNPARITSFENASWIWHGDDDPTKPPGNERHFTAKLSIPKDRKIKSAQALIAASDMFYLYINGKGVGTGTALSLMPFLYQIHPFLKPGDNEITVEVRSRNRAPGSAGLISRIVVEFEDGQPLTLVTDDSWKSAEPRKDALWKSAKIVGPYSCQPWGNLPEPKIYQFSGREMVVDFTRYDLKAEEPLDKQRNWSLINVINQKGLRPQDAPRPIKSLTPEELSLIKKRLPELLE